MGEELDRAVGTHAIDAVGGIAGDVEVLLGVKNGAIGHAREPGRIDLRLAGSAAAANRHSRYAIALAFDDE
jgi:hypothetical protein